MKIERRNPAKTTWDLMSIVYPDGRRVVLSGYDGHGFWWLRDYDEFMEETEKAGGVVETIQNIIFTATIVLTGSGRGRTSVVFLFQDKDEHDVRYQTGVEGMEALVRAIQQDSVQVINGALTGRFTFRKQGTSTFLFPYTGP